MPISKDIKVKIKLPFIGEIEGCWQPDENDEKAAWELYVELITRISIVELKPNEGLLREALSSLYSVFATTREILKKYGASIARYKDENSISFGYLAIAVINTVLRPVLAKWHPLLLDYESKKQKDISPVEHEKLWDRNQELRTELNQVRHILVEYAEILAEVAKVPLLIIDR
ncbi:hypothetical protein A0J48_020130 [Sphaerospermopsis aphanizomenoides BCCUSP55]|uniref:hypothetical protein n=1 Tax=Sphaerospermopsis aphanizomenoides TaxID=459663 RepID=UPI00190714C1|nr:hypothetical protein [Sphaerospermopsis aphanizomenoides]MBK1989811.1 hypothetical protein [Sphaerospermopsis aphanizomenoides BCCUSP55]